MNSSSTIAAEAAAAATTPRPRFQQIHAVYRVTCAESAVAAFGREIAYEQTVEVPESLVTKASILEEIVGRVESIEPDHGMPGSFLVTIGYNLKLAGYQIPQLLNLVYGNCSLKPNVTLVDLVLPDDFVDRFRGPSFGVAGLRELLGVYGRPLLATALKPVGSASAEFAAMARDFALGGGDLVKDDHNLHDESVDAFRERITRCQEAVEAANRQTGRSALYLPNLLAPVDQLERYLECAMTAGVRGILISPFLVGLDVTRHIAEKYRLVVMAHPTVTGAFFHTPQHGIEPGILLGKLFRLIGCDVSVFPNAGGRFTFTPEDCRSISDELRAPLGNLKPGWPAPAGGMRFDNLPQMAAEFGEDAVFLIGGALLSHSGNLTDSTRAFLQKIEEHFAAHLVAPAVAHASACELPPAAGAASAAETAPLEKTRQREILRRLVFQDDFSWEGRPAVVYKASAEIPFQGVTRHELIGQQGEAASFDLRYFQIEPGGYSSLEKHRHAHAIICVRGEGTLLCGGETLPLKSFDVAYVAPLEAHQLKNEGNAPFGFFCIVDHTRDRPQPA